MARTYGGFTVNDIVYYGGLLLGGVITSIVLRGMGWEQGLVFGLICIGVGVCVGFVCEQIYDRSQRRTPPRDDRPGEDRRDGW